MQRQFQRESKSLREFMIDVSEGIPAENSAEILGKLLDKYLDF